MPLTRLRVLKTAIRLADKDGIESLSMRKLARSLGVEAMSLYNHVANKGDLVDAMFELAMTEVELPPDSERWETAIRSYAIAMHDALIRHPWAGNLAVGLGGGGVPRPSRLAQMDWLIRRLREGGFSSALVYHGYHVLDAHILGFTLWELGHYAAAREMGSGFELEQFVADLLEGLRAQGNADLADHGEQHLSGEFDGVSAFEYGLDLILDGLRRAKRKR
jgi:AcrR family transcriptional regulator